MQACVTKLKERAHTSMSIWAEEIQHALLKALVVFMQQYSKIENTKTGGTEILGKRGYNNFLIAQIY